MQKKYHFFQKRDEGNAVISRRYFQGKQVLSQKWFLFLLGCISVLAVPSFSWALPPVVTTELGVALTANQAVVKQGDLLPFRLQIKANALQDPLTVRFKLPLGFEWGKGQLRVSTDGVSWQAVTDPSYQGASTFVWQSSLFSGGTDVWLNFALRVTSGGALSDGQVLVTVESGAIQKQASFDVNVKLRSAQAFVADAFDQRACVVGVVWLDCNDDGAKSADELAIPGVRLYLQDGMSVTTDREGLYSVCGLLPATHVLKVDKRSLPYGVVLDVENSRNASNPNSKFVDLKYGELHQADFKSKSCASQVLNRVLSRIEAASGVDVANYVKKNQYSFLSGASFNSDEDRLRVVAPCGDDDDRVLCVQKQLEVKRQADAAQVEQNRVETIRREEELLVAKELETKRKSDLLEAQRVQNAKAERVRQDENLRIAKQKQDTMLEQQREALELEIGQELQRREKALEQQDAMNKKEIEKKQQELYQQAQSLKFSDIKTPLGESSGVSLEAVDLDQLLELNESNGSGGVK